VIRRCTPRTPVSRPSSITASDGQTRWTRELAVPAADAAIDGGVLFVLDGHGAAYAFQA
jgi:outer membrane protein assembly factor BamB